MKMTKIIGELLILCSITIVFLSGCANNSRGVAGGSLGMIAGGALGAFLGDKPGHEKRGAIIGSLIGMAIGTFIGNRMDQQANALRDIPGMRDVQVDKDNQLIESQMQVQFNFDSYKIKNSEYSKLNQLANILREYPENIVVIEGHTDSTGTINYNQRLSERRARSIKNYLKTKHLGIKRLTSEGYGETQPITPNSSSSGRAINRRVEINISVDQKKARQLYNQTI
jgi:outer membrane protein OmpA-like peptidoglycan-associated protein